MPSHGIIVQIRNAHRISHYSLRFVSVICDVKSSFNVMHEQSENGHTHSREIVMQHTQSRSFWNTETISLSSAASQRAESDNERTCLECCGTIWLDTEFIVLETARVGIVGGVRDENSTVSVISVHD